MRPTTTQRRQRRRSLVLVLRESFPDEADRLHQRERTIGVYRKAPTIYGPIQRREKTNEHVASAASRISDAGCQCMEQVLRTPACDEQWN